jgi:hypothetical protein
VGHSAGSLQQKGKTSTTNSAETLGKFRASSKGGMTKGRETIGLLPEAEEDLRLQKCNLYSFCKYSGKLQLSAVWESLEGRKHC